MTKEFRYFAYLKLDCSVYNITQRLIIVPSLVTIYDIAGDYFQALRNIIAPAAPMVGQQSSLIIMLEWEYSSEPYRSRKSQLFIFRQS